MPDVPCSTAFEYAQGSQKTPECTALTVTSCPVCRSPVKIECWLAQYFASWAIWTDETLLRKNDGGSICISEASLNSTKLPEITSKIENLLPKLCQNIFEIQRTCDQGHSICTLDVCTDVLCLLRGTKKLDVCKQPVDRILPCKHVLKVECSTKNSNPPPVCKADTNEEFTYPCGLHKVRPGKCFELTTLQRTENPRCNQQVTCTRFRCGHKVSLPCYLKKTAEKFSPGIRLVADSSSQV